MKCIKCNNLLPDDSEFCQYCGARIENTADKNDANDSKEELQMPTSDVVVAPLEKTEPIITGIPASEPVNNPIELRFIEEDSESPKEAYNDSAETKEEKRVDVEIPHESNKKQKTRYCKNCGTMIDPKSKKCPNCSPSKKKRFCKNCGTEIPGGEKKCPLCKKKKKSNRIFKVFLAVIAIVTIIALGVFCVYQWMEIDDLQSKNSKLNSEITNLKSNNKKLQQQIDTLDNRLEDYWSMWYKLQFYEEYVVVVADDGSNKYHKYGCEDFDDSYFWAFNVSAAKSDGYNACKKCID